MYYPVQIPYILSRTFSHYMKYTETPALACGGFVICFWDMQTLSDSKFFVKNVIVADACIDLVASYDEKKIRFCRQE